MPSVAISTRERPGARDGSGVVRRSGSRSRPVLPVRGVGSARRSAAGGGVHRRGGHRARWPPRGRGAPGQHDPEHRAHRTRRLFDFVEFTSSLPINRARYCVKPRPSRSRTLNRVSPLSFSCFCFTITDRPFSRRTSCTVAPAASSGASARSRSLLSPLLRPFRTRFTSCGSGSGSGSGPSPSPKLIVSLSCDPGTTSPVLSPLRLRMPMAVIVASPSSEPWKV